VGIGELLIQKIPYKKINEMLGHPSSATINRVNDIVKNGDGSFRKIITRANGVEGC